MDRLTSLAVFVAAVDEGSFAAAARRFGLSPAMAGKHVSAIETEVHARLLQRSTRQLSLTDAGLLYYERCKQILEAYDEAVREAGDIQTSARGTLRIAAPATFGEMHVSGIVARYLTDNPYVNAEVLLGDHYTDLLDIRVDVAIRIGRLTRSQLVTRRLAPCRMVLCASPNWLAQNGTPCKPEDLHDAPRLAFSEAVSEGNWTLIDAQQQAFTLKGPCRLLANNTQFLVASALAGMGIVYAPTFVLGEHIRRKTLIPLLPGYTPSELVIQAVYPSALHIPAKVRHFVDYLAQAFGDNPPWDKPE
ncbi:LysR family transcriptional regulator [Mangrovibacter phragmitis]|uniref:LysR family transcriptional regulator n=1 Tax=Mangrovibacter phragmitis TaxID=1691903 RepID=A0A1B7L8E7_9ENTR|nr:LysR family transcriptional regulator [Mangrovibacter phragmitis]OAT78491.1 LysR family transcriptional regulator [Mangrovibacter phragmitis]